MVRSNWISLILPLIGVALIGAAIRMAWPDFKSWSDGRSLPAKVAATLIKSRDGKLTLAQNASYEFRMRGLAGWELQGAYSAGQPIQWEPISNPDPHFPPDIKEQFAEAKVAAEREGVVAFRRFAIRWRIQPPEGRIGELEIFERISAEPVLHGVMSGTRQLPAPGATDLSDKSEEFQTSIQYSFENETTRRPRVTSSFYKNDSPIDVGKTDFFLYRQGADAILLPVIESELNGGSQHFVSDIGRVGGPHPSLAPGSDLTLYSATISGNPPFTFTASIPKMAGREPLRWVSLACEAIFSRWAYPFVLAFFGIGCLIASILQFSLLFRDPSQKP